MKKITFLIMATMLSLFASAQSFTALYTFDSVKTTSGTTDPSFVPTATGVTFGNFSSVGASANPSAPSRFSYTNWPTGSTNANDAYSSLTGSISTSEYYEVTITPNAGYIINLDSIRFTAQRSGTGIRTYAVRSSIDGYASNLAAVINPANTKLSVQAGNIFFWNLDGTTTAQIGSTIRVNGTTGFSGISSPVKFRFYGWNAEAGTGTFSIDNVSISGSAALAPLNANFSAANVCFADSVHFNDMSTGPNTITNWAWDFGDASLISNDTNPVHFYANAGTYNVTLTVIDNMLGTDSYTGSVTVYSKPVSKFSAPLSVCGTLPVQLYDSATVVNSTINSLNYNFGDPASGANNTSILQDPTHVFSATGTYTLTQIATSAFGCKDTSSRTINVNAIPVAGFSSAGSACSGTSAQFTDTSSIASGSISNFDWNFADAASGVNNTSTMQDPTHTFNTAGSYMVTQVVTSALGCADTVAGLFIVNPMVTPSLTISGPTTTICEGDSIVGIIMGFNVGANPSYEWFVDGMSLGVFDSVLLIPAGVITAGTYTVTATLISDAACASTTTATSSPEVLTVNALPATPVITASGSTLSTTISYSTYQWDFMGSALGTASTQTATTDGDYSVMVTDGNGCAATSDPYTYIGTGINNYSSSNDLNIYPNPSSNGIFTYSVTEAKAIVTLFNIVGKQISSTEVLKGTHTIDLSSEANGNYFISIKTDKNVITKKLIVNK